ncbi:hypothetical protein C8Q79DRAFT_979824, partial [Trametes meyenii]
CLRNAFLRLVVRPVAALHKLHAWLAKQAFLDVLLALGHFADYVADILELCKTTPMLIILDGVSRASLGLSPRKGCAGAYRMAMCQAVYWCTVSATSNTSARPPSARALTRRGSNGMRVLRVQSWTVHCMGP